MSLPQGGDFEVKSFNEIIENVCLRISVGMDININLSNTVRRNAGWERVVSQGKKVNYTLYNCLSENIAAWWFWCQSELLHIFAI